MSIDEVGQQELRDILHTMVPSEFDYALIHVSSDLIRVMRWLFYIYFCKNKNRFCSSTKSVKSKIWYTAMATS